MKTKHSKGRSRGNVKAQQKRRKERQKDLKSVKRQSDPYQLIDGNWTHYPVGYCMHYGGFISLGLLDNHRCVHRQCRKFRVFGCHE